ncbi:DUF1850 domain-containing protein [Halobacillus seohaensis]|uniref:DUF1850 domain-containing protein n=2 Tax=Halobacillus seohaensis TaxID=447421 RepID=A0ABW2EMS8_9BACI
MTIKVPTLMITSEGHPQYVYHYKEEAEFRVRWQHSVEKESWEEMFVLQDGLIELTGTRFKTFGAGVPSNAGDHTFIKDGWVYMTGITHTIGKSLVLRTGEHTEHQLTYEEDTVHQLNRSQAYEITIASHSILNSIKHYISAKLR